MLKKRIIPTLLWKDVGLVKGVSFNSWRRVGSVLPSINVYNARDVDEMILLDITATNEKQEIDFNAIADYSEECMVPFTVGGGVDSVEKIKKLLYCGADKVAINSHVYQNPNLIKEAANRFGSQCIVVSVDVKKHADGKYYCYSHAGTRLTNKEVVSWVKEIESLGAGELLITSIALDGTMKGYDCELISAVTMNVDIPVIASGGAGTYEHFYEVLKRSNASAVAAASVFHFTEITPLKIKEFLSERDVPVRNMSAQ